MPPVEMISKHSISFGMQATLSVIAKLYSRHDIRFDSYVKSPYASRYYAEYTWGDREQHRVEILDRDFTGEATKLHLAEFGWIEEIGTRDKMVLDPIFISKGKLQIYDPDNTIRIELYTIDQERFKVIHYVNEQITWAGKLLTEQYWKSLDKRKSSIQILATDALGDLKDVIYGDRFTTSLQRGVGDKSVKDIIVQILSSLGYEFDFEISFDWHAYDLFEDRALDHINFLDSMVTARTVFEVLESLMITLGARVYMEDGKWIIEQIEKKDAPFIVHRYNNYGTFIESYEYDPVIDAKFEQDHEYKFRGAGGHETFRSGYNRVKVYSSIPRSDSSRRSVAIPLGASDRNFPFGYYSKIKDFNFQYWVDENTPAFWELSDGANVARSADTAHGDAYSIQLNNSLSSGEHFFVNLLKTEKGATQDFILRYYAKRVGSGITLFAVVIRVGNRFAQYDEVADEIFFDTTPSVIPQLIGSDGWNEYTIPRFTLPDEGGDLVIQFRGGFVVLGSYQGIRFDYIRPLIIEDPAKLAYEAYDEESMFNRTLDVGEVFMTDELFPYHVPRLLRRHWKRSAYEVDEQPSGDSIMQLVADLHLAMNSKTVIVRNERYLQRSPYIPDIRFRHTLQIDSRLYSPVFMQKYFRRGIFSGQWVQIKDLSEEIYPPFDPNNPCDNYDTYGDGVPPQWERWGVFWYMGHRKRFRESDSQHFLRNEAVISALYGVLHGWRFIGDELGGGHDGIFPANYHITAEFEIQTFNLSSWGHGVPRRFGIFAQYQGATPAHPRIPGVYCGINKSGFISYNSGSPDYLVWGAVLELGWWRSSPFRLSELEGVLRMEIYKSDEFLMCELYNEAGLIKALAIPVPDPNDVDDPAWRYWSYSSQPDYTGNIGCYNLGTGIPSQIVNLYSICVYDETTFSPPPLPDFDGDLNFILLSEIDAQEHEHEKIFITLQSEVFDDGTP